MFGNDPIVQQAWEELRVLLERFAGSRSLSGVFNAIRKLRDDAQTDEEFRAWFKRANEFVRRVSLSLPHLRRVDKRLIPPSLVCVDLP